MCGIAGFITKDLGINSKLILDSMTNSLHHRGPDDSGSLCLKMKDSTLVGLGHTRLSILDLSDHAHQPIACNDVILVFNGEIYNYLEIRESLKALGHEFESTGDTEVVLKAYLEWGEECFKHFNGMWGMAIFDQRKDRIILSRDRFGKKPLHYYKDNDKIVFSSEIKSIFCYPNIEKKPNYEKVFRYISGNYRYVDIDDSSYYDEIVSVPKGSYMVIDPELRTKENKYWKLQESTYCFDGMRESNIIDSFRELFIDSVKIRLRSDVPVSCMLSGGMDSTSITCVAHKVLGIPVMTFSGITGEDKGVYDESEYIDEVIKETGAEHKYIKPEPSDLFTILEEMLFFHDEPICTVTWYSLYLIAKEIKKHNVKVVLNGHGGDELLAGYWDHYHYYFYDLEDKCEMETLDYEQKAWLKNHDRKVAEICSSRDYIRGLIRKDNSETLRFPDYSVCFSQDFAKKYRRNIDLESGFENLLSQRLHKELLFETVPASLRAEDRNTMAYSIESRSPLLDYRLAEFCFSLPSHFKIRDGVGKWILREAMKGILPEAVRTRKDKSGFIAPADRWFRTTNKREIKELINSSDSHSTDMFNIAQLNKFFDDHTSQNRNHSMFIWQLINMLLWQRRLK